MKTLLTLCTLALCLVACDAPTAPSTETEALCTKDSSVCWEQPAGDPRNTVANDPRFAEAKATYLAEVEAQGYTVSARPLCQQFVDSAAVWIMQGRDTPKTALSGLLDCDSEGAPEMACYTKNP